MNDQVCADDNELDVAVAPYSYNPSSWRQRVPICILAGCATLIAAYMALYQWRLVDSAWDPLFGEGTKNVLDSEVARTMDRWIGIPDAALGAFAYLADAVLGMAGSARRWQYRPWLVILFGIDVIPLGVVSSVLVVLQATVVGHWCFLCLVTAVISLILAYWAYDEVLVSMKYLLRVWKISHSWRELGNACFGIPTEMGRKAGHELVREARTCGRESSNA
jgi:uncharacterized membrane protein